MKKILKKDLEKIKNTTAAFDKANKVIQDRIGYILKTISNVFCRRFDEHWDVIDETEDYLESKTLSIKKIISKDKFVAFLPEMPLFSSKENDDMVFLDKNNKEVEVYGSFPKKWLFEDFEEELMLGKRKYQNKLRNIELKRKQKLLKEQESSLKKMQWLINIKEKLSVDEWSKLENHFRTVN